MAETRSLFRCTRCFSAVHANQRQTSDKFSEIRHRQPKQLMGSYTWLIFVWPLKCFRTVLAVIGWYWERSTQHLIIIQRYFCLTKHHIGISLILFAHLLLTFSTLKLSLKICVANVYTTIRYCIECIPKQIDAPIVHSKQTFFKLFIFFGFSNIHRQSRLKWREICEIFPPKNYNEFRANVQSGQLRYAHKITVKQ